MGDTTQLRKLTAHVKAGLSVQAESKVVGPSLGHRAPLGDENVLIGFDTATMPGVQADAGVCLVQTVDFFTPIVDDPYTFAPLPRPTP